MSPPPQSTDSANDGAAHHDALLSTARQQWLADQHDAALLSFRQLHQQLPNDLRLAVEFANYLGMRFEVDEATDILKRCESKLGDHPQAMFQIGMAYERAYRTDDAMRCYRTCADRHGGARVKVVEWLERRGRVEAAGDALGDLASHDAALWRGRLLQRCGRLDEAEQVLIKLADNDDVPTNVRIASHYELAELYDRRDAPSQAIQRAMLAKELQRPQLATHLARAKSMARIEANFVSTITQEHFAHWQAELSSRHVQHAPIALLTGPPRSGTSVMARMLGMHADLAVADEIEAYPTYLQPTMLKGKSGSSAADVLNSLEEEHVDECRALYRKWISNALNRDITNGCLLDKFPSTTFLIPPFRRLFPNAVIVMAIRDPRDVVVSCFLRRLELNPVSAMFSQLELTVQRCRAECKAWLELRKKLPQPWCEVRYENVVSGDYSQLANVHKTLGLEWRNDFADIRSSLDSEPVRSPTYAQLREQIDDRRVGRWERYREFLAPQLTVLNDLADEMGYG